MNVEPFEDPETVHDYAERHGLRWIGCPGPVCMPNEAAIHFTHTQLCVLAAIGEAFIPSNHCRLTASEIAAMACVTPSTVRKTISLAHKFGVIEVTRFRNKPTFIVNKMIVWGT